MKWWDDWRKSRQDFKKDVEGLMKIAGGMQYLDLYEDMSSEQLEKSFEGILKNGEINLVDGHLRALKRSLKPEEAEQCIVRCVEMGWLNLLPDYIQYAGRPLTDSEIDNCYNSMVEKRLEVVLKYKGDRRRLKKREIVGLVFGPNVSSKDAVCVLGRFKKMKLLEQLVNNSGI